MCTTRNILYPQGDIMLFPNAHTFLGMCVCMYTRLTSRDAVAD